VQPLSLENGSAHLLSHECRAANCEGFYFHEDHINPDAPSVATAGCGIGDNFYNAVEEKLMGGRSCDHKSVGL
jgi:hypothetical protein